jgi:hypothetical protein
MIGIRLSTVHKNTLFHNLQIESWSRFLAGYFQEAQAQKQTGYWRHRKISRTKIMYLGTGEGIHWHH